MSQETWGEEMIPFDDYKFRLHFQNIQGIHLHRVLKLRPEVLYAFLYPVRTRQGKKRL